MERYGWVWENDSEVLTGKLDEESWTGLQQAIGTDKFKKLLLTWWLTLLASMPSLNKVGTA